MSDNNPLEWCGLHGVLDECPSAGAAPASEPCPCLMAMQLDPECPLHGPDAAPVPQEPEAELPLVISSYIHQLRKNLDSLERNIKEALTSSSARVEELTRHATKIAIQRDTEWQRAETAISQVESAEALVRETLEKYRWITAIAALLDKLKPAADQKEERTKA